MGDQCDVVCYFLSRREADADSSRFLAAVVPQLAYLLEEDPPVADSHQYRALWQRAARRAEAEDRPLLLVVDGLDEDLRPPGLPSVAALLPPGAGGRIHVLVSSRPHLDLRRDLPPGHALAQTEPVTIRPFEGGDELADLALQEIDDLLRRDDDGLAADVLGLLTAAAGPLAVADLAAMSAVAPQSAASTRRIRRLVTVEAARSLQPVGLAKGDRYQFAHGSLLEQAQENEDLSDPDYLRRIHQWADSWRAAGWPPMDGTGHGTPRYLLDTYPSTLTEDPPRLAALAGDAGWVTTAIRALGVDAVLAELKTAGAAAPGEPRLAAMHAVVRGQAHHLRGREVAGDPGFVPRQLCLQAAELGEDVLAADFRTRQLACDDPGPVLQWTTRRASPALILELGRHEGGVAAVAVLPDGRVVTGGGSTARVLVWDPARAGRRPGRARPPRGQGGCGGGAAGRAGGHRRQRRRAGAGVGPGASRAPARSSWAATSGARWRRWRCCRTGGWSPAATTGGCWCGTRRAGRRPGRAGPPRAARWRRWRCCRTGGWSPAATSGRVLVWDPAAPGSRPGRARPPRGRGGGGGGAAGRAGGHRRLRRRAGAGVGPGCGRQPARSSSAATRAGWGRWRCCRTGGWSPAAATTGGCWCGTRQSRAPARSSWAATTAAVGAVAVLPDGRVVTGGDDGRVLVWDPGAAERGPVELGRHEARWGRWRCCRTGGWSPAAYDGRVLVWDPASRAPARSSSAATRRGAGGGGAAGRAGGHRRLRRRAGAGVGPGAPGSRPGRAGPPRRPGGRWRWRCCRTGGWSRGGDRAGGCWCGTRREPGAGPVELGRHEGRVAGGGGAAGRAGGHRRRRRRAGAGVGPGRAGRRPGRARPPRRRGGGGGGAAGRAGGHRRATTGGCWCGTRRSRAPARSSSAATSGGVGAVAVLPDGRVVTGGDDDRVRLWNVQSSSPGTLLACSASALATSLSPSGARLFIGHAVGGISCWEIRPATQNTPEARQREGNAMQQQT